MDIEKLVEQLRAKSLYTDKASLEIMDLCMAAATALSTLQAENEKLRAELESLKKGHCTGCSVPVVEASALRDLNEAPRLRADLEQVKRERDAAQALLAERIGVMGAEPITAAFGLPLDCLRELAQAELEQVKADRSRYRQIAEVQGRRIDELEKIIQDKSQALDDVPDPIAADERQTSPGRQWDWLLSRFTRRED
ncbi:hypothetical protein [uncultured Intestinimonas sp.]|uniref:hypothetical protein n=1 Tax=uncultured Intestinimonas sp. TaxID=1689265 RepID=UPI0025FBD6F1|nr:hypothetical protein [uncultured Intestinimonas sp.]